jgi:hypothetical protein
LSTSLLQSKHLFFSQEGPIELRLLDEPSLGVFRQLEDPPEGLMFPDPALFEDVFLDQQSELMELADIPQSNFFDLEENDKGEFDLVNDITEFPELEVELPTSKQ